MPVSATSLLILFGAYLLGSLSGCPWPGRDMRTLGSGNGVSTDALRTRGWRFSLAAAIFDVATGALAAWLALRLAPLNPDFSVTAHGYAAAFAAAVGHVWPPWRGFRGGKGAATLVGGLLVLWPWIVPWLFLAWAMTVVFTGYVAAAAVLAGIALALLAWGTGAETARLVFSVAAALLLLFTHRDNLRRLWDGGESRFERARLLHRIWRQRG